MEPIAINSATIGDQPVQTVNARDLHAFLEVQTAFKDWIARRIGEYEFSEGKDFCSFLSESSGGRPAKEYALSLDMAKELAMVERNEKGKQARAYFIECERRAKSYDAAAALNDPATLRQLLLNQTEERLKLESRVEAMKGDVVAFERIAKADGSLNITETAKSLQVRPTDLFKWLSAHGWIYKRAGSSNWLGYQSKTQAGFIEHKVEVVVRSDGTEKVVEQVRITPKGLARLSVIFPVMAVG